MSKRAAGGPITPGGEFWVGERGPEDIVDAAGNWIGVVGVDPDAARKMPWLVWYVPIFRNPPEVVHDPGLGGPSGGYLVRGCATEHEARAYAGGRPQMEARLNTKLVDTA